MSVETIVGVLTAEDPALRAGAAALLVDHVLAQPLSTLVSADVLSELTLQAMSEPALEHALQAHIDPGAEALRQDVLQPGETVGAAVPADMHGAILDLIGNPDGPRGEWLRGALSPGLLVDLLAPVFQDVLLGFIAKVPGAAAVTGDGGGGAPGVMGKLGAAGRSRAGKLFDVGRSVVGGLGIEAMLKPLAQDFSRGAVSAFQHSLRKRLQSAEGRELLLQLQQGAFDHVMAVQLTDIDADLVRLPVRDVLALLPPLVAHNLKRPLGRAALQAQVRRYYAVEGQRPLGTVLDDWGVRAAVREVAVQRATELSQGLFASEGFAHWLGTVLTAAQRSDDSATGQ